MGKGKGNKGKGNKGKVIKAKWLRQCNKGKAPKVP